MEENKLYNENLLNVLPDASDTNYNPGDKVKVKNANNRFKSYILTSNRIWVQDQGITDDEQNRIDALTNSQVNKLIGLNTQEQTDTKIGDVGAGSVKQYIDIKDTATNTRIDNISLGVVGEITTSQTLSQLNALADGVYKAQTSGTYANALVAKVGYYTTFKKVGTVWTLSNETQMPQAEGTTVLNPIGTGVPQEKATAEYVQPAMDTVIVSISKNMFNKNSSSVELGTITPTGPFASNHNFRIRYNKDVMVPGKTYSIKKSTPIGTGGAAAVFFNISGVVIGYIDRVVNQLTYTFAIPAETEYTYVHIGYLLDANTYPKNDNSAVNTVMLIEGVVPENYVPYGRRIGIVDVTKIERYDEIEQLLDDNVVVVVPSVNKIDTSLVKFDKRYSPATNNIVANTGTIYVITDYIPVEEGKQYIMFTPERTGLAFTGGYFANNSAVNSIDDITFMDPVDKIGKTFTVPTGLNINYIAVNLEVTVSGGNTLNGRWFLSEGEIAPNYTPYGDTKQINPLYLPDNGGNIDTGSELSKFTTFDNLSYGSLSDKIFDIIIDWLLLTENVSIVHLGTSLSARTIEHNSARSDGNARPPLMHSNNAVSYIWDKINRPGQYYRRYDYPGVFTLLGTFTETATDSNWDDSGYRNGLTKFATGSASIAYQIPIDTWASNFIYRTDALGSEAVTVTVEQGNNKVQVFDEINQTWVELNNYVFSQKEPPPTILTSITIIDPITNNPKVINDYQVKGNTIYQKRLLMRCKGPDFDSRSEVKNIKFSSSSGRLLFWGIEGSNSENMLRYVNASRGSHGSTIVNGTPLRDLSAYQDSEVWPHKPKLIILEDPIYNGGAGGKLVTSRPSTYYANVTKNYVDAAPVSIFNRCATLGLTAPKIVMYNVSIMNGTKNTTDSGSINEDGTLRKYLTSDGKMMSSLDAQMQSYIYMKQAHPEFIYINALRNWINAGVKIHGDICKASVGSGPTGNTFTSDGTHPNDLGNKILARMILPVFDMML